MTKNDIEPVAQYNTELVAILEQKSKLPEGEFMGKVLAFLQTLPPNYLVVFDLLIPEESDELGMPELREALEKTRMATPGVNECQLIVQTPYCDLNAVNVANTSSSRAADASGINRNPFYPFLFGIRGHELLQIDPTGIVSMSRAQKYTIPIEAIGKITISNNHSLPLSPALSLTGEIIPVTPWDTTATLPVF